MRIRMIVLPLLALGIGVFYWQTAPDTDVPACTWRIGEGTDIHQGQNYEELAPETPIRLSVRLNRARHLYVFSHSAEDGTLLMFPSPGLKSDAGNPLPAGQTVLPGKQAGAEVYWTTRAGIEAVTTFMVLASDEPIASLEELLPRLRHWSNRVFPDQRMSVTQTSVETEIVGRPHQPIPSPLLRAAAAIGSTDPSPNGPMKPANAFEGVFTTSWKIREDRTKKPVKPSLPELPTIPELTGERRSDPAKPRPAGK